MTSDGKPCCSANKSFRHGHAAQIARVGYAAPNFTASAVTAEGKIEEIKLEDYKGKYVLLYFYPLDFTFVCPSEILAFNRAVGELNSKNVVLLGCSVDSVYSHIAWRNTALENGGIGPLQHPLISDITKEIATSYGVLLPKAGVALRGLFLIDKEGIIRHMVVNDLPLGRSVEEAIRMVDSLQFTEENGEVCPVGWKKGSVGMKPTAEGVAAYLKEQVKTQNN